MTSDESSSVPHESLVSRWVLRPIRNQLTQGKSPHKIAQALAFGLTLGIFPIIGSTTILTLIVGVPLKLNQPVLQAFKTLAAPIQWLLILGFYRLGERLFKADPVSLSIPNMVSEFSDSPLLFFAKYGQTALYGVAVWCLLAPLAILAIYAATKPLVQRLSISVKPAPKSP